MLLIAAEVEQTVIVEPRHHAETGLHSRAALATIASNTGCTSPGELEMTRRISAVAA